MIPPTSIRLARRSSRGCHVFIPAHPAVGAAAIAWHSRITTPGSIVEGRPDRAARVEPFSPALAAAPFGGPWSITDATS